MWYSSKIIEHSSATVPILVVLVSCVIARGAVNNDSRLLLYDDTYQDSPIPVIDMSAFTYVSNQEKQLQTVKEIGKACRSIGFFAIVNHGVPLNIVENTWEVTTQFFDLSVHEKMKVASRGVEYPYGYEQSESLSVGKEMDERICDLKKTCKDDASLNLQQQLPDLKETFSLGPEDPQKSGMPARRYPSSPADMNRFYSAYYQEMEKLAMRLLSAFAMALDLPNDWFETKMDRHMSALRALNYPNLSSYPHAVFSPGQLRAGAHSDYGVLTILKSGGPGLQVQTNDCSTNNGNGECNEHWMDVPYSTDDNVYIVNLGDLMQRWTNDEWKSTLHRVVIPSIVDNESPSNRRQSLAFFVNVNGDTQVTPIASCVNDKNPTKYKTVVARDYLLKKHLASIGVS